MTEAPATTAAPPTERTAKPQRWLGWLAAALALLGWWLSIDLLRVTGGAHAMNPWLEASCGPVSDEAGPSDCLSVLQSRWARIEPPDTADSLAKQRIGLPWAALGAAYFAFVAVWYVFVGPPTRNRRAWHLLIAAVVVLGVCHSVYFMRVMAFVLHKWCAGCVAAHGVNGLLLLITIAAYPWARKPAVVRPHPQRRLALAALLAGLLVAWLHVTETKLIVVASAAGQLRNHYFEIVNDPEYARWRYQRQPIVTIPLREDEDFAGDADAPHTLIVFIDFQCPACKLAHERVAELIEQHGDFVRVAFRHFPQDAECNRQYQGGGHPASCRAARAAEAARLVGGAAGAAKMRNLLYERQRDLELNRFNDWATELGLDVTAFAGAIESPAVADRIQTDIELGTQLGIDKMPALFLDDRRVEHWRNPKTWTALLGLDESQAPPASQPQPGS